MPVSHGTLAASAARQWLLYAPRFKAQIVHGNGLDSPRLRYSRVRSTVSASRNMMPNYVYVASLIGPALSAKCAFFGECDRVTAELLAEFAPIETDANH